MVRPSRHPPSSPIPHPHDSFSSAKDQLTGASVAIKKIMKPFSTPVLSKRTYRELKLLKHIQHENVGIPTTSSEHSPIPSSLQIISLSDVFISPLEDM
jgi:p38 MAP kinase